MGDEVISTIPARETDEFLKYSVDDFVPIPREFKVTSNSVLECDMPATTPLPPTDNGVVDFDIDSPLGEYVVDFLMKNVDVAGLPRLLVKQLFNHLLKNPSLIKGMSDEPLGDDSKPVSYDLLMRTTWLVTLPSPYLVVLGDEKIDLLLRDDLDTLLTRDRDIDLNPIRDIEELEYLLANDHVPVPRVFDEPLGNSDSMSRSSETSDLFEELTTEIGLDDSISTYIDYRYYDSEGDILYFEQLLNEDTSSNVS
ncbi:hypothetical protein Tco_0512391 [Tanacetum coccineum]